MSRYNFDPESSFDANDHYMKEALKEAHLAFQADEVPVGAVIVCKDRIIARAHNLVERLVDPTAHAEMQAYTIAANYLNSKYLLDCTLYVTLEPCAMCAGAAHWAQIPTIVFGAYDKEKGVFSTDKKLLHSKVTVLGGILEEECSTLVRNFFKEKRI